MRRRRADPWEQALQRHFSPAPGDAGGPTGARRRSVRLGVAWLTALGVLIVALIATAGYFGFLADENLERADRWRDRANETQAVLEARTRALNRQTARLNLASNRLLSGRTSLARSERDVTDLETRQRELAAEKAEVEDERAGLERRAADLAEVTTSLSACNSGLVYLIQTIADGFTPDSETANQAAFDCEQAQSALDSYAAAYGLE